MRISTAFESGRDGARSVLALRVLRITRPIKNSKRRSIESGSRPTKSAWLHTKQSRLMGSRLTSTSNSCARESAQSAAVQSAFGLITVTVLSVFVGSCAIRVTKGLDSSATNRNDFGQPSDTSTEVSKPDIFEQTYERAE